ncbi:MAG: REC domain-containing phosphodiesterase [Xanthomonadales bacterium]|nr:REC domain-containing phosphodiesterase [Xanthomonadales bacterium]MDH4018947.1 REC domain-containing phosphodiesterase [Xanthomonadales bacterium]
MHSAYLLVIDNSPDHAQVINSFLRNSGIAVRVVSASGLGELETALQEKTPFLVLIGKRLPSSMKISQVLVAADQHSTPVVMQVEPDDTANIEAAIATHPLLVINAEDNDQLMQVVKRHMSGGKTAREYDDLLQKQEELQHRYNLLLDSARDSIAYIHEGLHIYANRAYLDLLQVKTLEDVEGISLLELMTTDESVDPKKLLRDMNQSVFPDEALAVTINTLGNQHLKAELTFSPAKFHGEQCIQMMVRQQDANHVLHEELDRLRKTDHLTHMINRQTFTAKLTELIGEGLGDDHRTAVMYIEIDGISQLQHDLGMDGIDTYILDLANVISGCTNENDIPSRFSDNGFVVLIRGDESSSLQEAGDCILENYANHIIDLGDQTKTASCSIGMTTLGPLTRDAEEVIGQAKTAFKQASETGNTLVRYKPALTTVHSGEAERDWVERIRYALNNHDFYTVQQSIVDLEGENEGLFENRTFMREDGGDTGASEFMLAAERNDLGGTIDRYVIPQIMLAITGTGDRHIISLSTNSILDFSFPNWFQRMLHETEVEGSQLLLQVSAIVAESHLKPTRRVVEELQLLGCNFVLSEFDNDRRTLQLLEHLPISTIKLRSGLAKGLSSNTTNQEIIRTVVRAVEARNMTIIADEVQDASDLAVLWQCGVKLVTGDFLNEAPQVVGQ